MILHENLIIRLTLWGPITTAADDKSCDIIFEKKKDMILHENRLPAENSHEISCLICYFEKAAKFVFCCKIVGGALWVNPLSAESPKMDSSN